MDEKNSEGYWLSPGGPPAPEGANVVVIDDHQMPALIPLIKKAHPEVMIIYRSHFKVRKTWWNGLVALKDRVSTYEKASVSDEVGTVDNAACWSHLTSKLARGNGLDPGARWIMDMAMEEAGRKYEIGQPILLRNAVDIKGKGQDSIDRIFKSNWGRDTGSQVLYLA
ncbi:hypothetical protein HOY82DRAFT_601535 [Tuber indicum]|nr:hypothetical protein HOY82DRAFT_601535 [Tuber indicum]